MYFNFKAKGSTRARAKALVVAGLLAVAGSVQATAYQLRQTTPGMVATAGTSNPAPASTPCSLPWGGTLASGSTYSGGPVYSAASVYEPASCASVAVSLSCNNGTLSSATATNQCVVKDASLSSVTLLTGFDNNVTDATGKTLTNSGVTFSASPALFGGYAAQFNGSTSYITTPYVKANSDWFAGDFTLEAWVNASSWSTWSYVDGNPKSVLIGNAALNSASNYWSFGPTASGAVTFYYWVGSSKDLTTSATLPTGTWNHIALVKSGTTISIYLNGTLSASAAVQGTPLSGTEVPLAIGRINSRSLAGVVDELRITKGVARYTGNFTVPSSAFPRQ